MAEHLLKSGAKRVYNYVFAYNGDLNGMGMNKTWSGATHGEELMYLFDLHAGNKSEQDQIVIDTLAELWTNFAKYG